MNHTFTNDQLSAAIRATADMLTGKPALHPERLALVIHLERLLVIQYQRADSSALPVPGDDGPR